MEKMIAAAVSTRNWIGESERSLENTAKWVKKAVEQNAELIVFPELNISGYVHDRIAWSIAETIPGPSTDKLIEIAKMYDVVLCAGLLERVAGIIYNTQVLVNSDGLVGKQQKIHIPAGEYEYWRGGFQFDVFDIGKARVGIAICYDALFDELARSLFYKGTEVLIMPFAYWSEGPRSRFIEEDITGLCYRTACYSNGFFGILANNAGERPKSELEPEGIKFPGWAGIISPNGDVLAFTREDGTDESMVVLELDPALLAERRSNPWFQPRCLRPELYLDLRQSHMKGS